jgi:hypothetical protein
MPYPGHDGIKQAIPYIEHLRYENGEMNYKIGCNYSNVKNLEQHVKNRVPEIMGKKDDIRGEIGKLWAPPTSLSGSSSLLSFLHSYDDLSANPEDDLSPNPEDDLLHLIRLVMLATKDKQSEQINFDTDEKNSNLSIFVHMLQK